MKNSTILLIAGAGILAWWYFRTNRRRLELTNTATVKAGRSRQRPRTNVGVPQAAMGCCPGQPMGTMYSEDSISGPYGEFNIGGESGQIAPKQHTWDRMEDVSAL